MTNALQGVANGKASIVGLGAVKAVKSPGFISSTYILILLVEYVLYLHLLSPKASQAVTCSVYVMNTYNLRWSYNYRSLPRGITTVASSTSGISSPISNTDLDSFPKLESDIEVRFRSGAEEEGDVRLERAGED